MSSGEIIFIGLFGAWCLGFIPGIIIGVAATGGRKR